MDRIFTPWRLDYLVSARGDADQGCIFCSALESDDDRGKLILHRGRGIFVLFEGACNLHHVPVQVQPQQGRLELEAQTRPVLGRQPGDLGGLDQRGAVGGVEYGRLRPLVAREFFEQCLLLPEIEFAQEARQMRTDGSVEGNFAR